MHEMLLKIIGFIFYMSYLITGQQQQIFIDINNTKELPSLTVPINFTLLRIVDGHTAEFGWQLLPLATKQGPIRGYKIQVWSDTMSDLQDFIVGPTRSKARVDKMIPFTLNHVRVSAFTDDTDGPSTSVISLETPEWVPGPVVKLEAIPMSSRSIYLTWISPLNANGILTGYHVYLEKKINKIMYESADESFHALNDPWTSGMKITDLEINTKYRFTVRATTAVGEGTPSSIDGKTNRKAKMPTKPNFVWHPVPTTDGNAAIKILWLPDSSGHPGDEIFLAYREDGVQQWTQVEPEDVWNQIIVRNLKPLTKYAVRVVAVDEDYASRSNIMIIKTVDVGKKIAENPIKLNATVIEKEKPQTKNTNNLSLKKLAKGSLFVFSRQNSYTVYSYYGRDHLPTLGTLLALKFNFLN